MDERTNPQQHAYDVAYGIEHGTVSIPNPNGTDSRASASTGTYQTIPNGSAGPVGVPSPMPVAAVQPSARVEKGQSHGWIVAIFAIVALCLVILFSASMCSSSISGLFGSPSSAPAAVSEPSILVVDLDGSIQYDGTACSPEGLKKLLDRAEKDDNIKGVILRVNSGGGTATAGEEMAGYVRDFPKPIVVTSEATNASAAYEISSQADYIFTAKTTSIGSIGVLLQVTDLSGLYEKLGISIESITSADSKDAGQGNRPFTEEERQWYQAMVDQISADFISTVAEGRNMTFEEVSALANGLPYTGLDAVDNGLADEIGGLEDAVDHISGELGYEKPLPTVSFASSSSDLAWLLDLLSKDNTSLDEKALAALIERLETSDAS